MYGSAWYIHKKPIPLPINREHILALGDNFKGIYRVLWFTLYLTGGRIGEVLKLRRDDFSIQETEKGKVLLVNLYTEKNKRMDFRNIPILDGGVYSEMLKPLLGEIDKCEYGMPIFPMTYDTAQKQFAKIKIIVRATHHKEVIDDYKLKLRSHYLRHCRLTHLVTIHNYNEFQLMQFAGWTNIKPASFYVRLGWRDLVAKQMTNYNLLQV